MTPQSAAFQYAEALDRTLASCPDYLTEAMFTEVGELLGGLSVAGFRADLETHLAEIENDLIGNASGRDYSPGRGGNDPDFYISDALLGQLDTACEEAARKWLLTAQAIMKPAEQMREAA